MPNKNYDNEMFDLLIKQSIEVQAVKEDDELISKYASTDQFSVSKDFEKMIKKSTLKPKKRNHLKMVVSLAVCLVLMVTFFTTPAFGNVTDWIRTLFNQRQDTIQVDIRDQAAYDDYVTLYYSLDPDRNEFYVPVSKYTGRLIPTITVIQDESRSFIKMEFIGDGYFIYIDQVYPPNDVLFVDNEMGEFEHVDIKENDAYMRISEESTITWDNGSVGFNIYTNLGEEKLLDIANSMYAFTP